MKINLICSANRAYIQHMCAMLSSAFANTKSMIEVHILHNDYTDENEAFVNKMLSSYGHAKLNFHQIDDSIFEKIEIKYSRLTIHTLFRLLAAQILPEDVDKAIYLDSDIIVEGDLEQLLNIDIGDHYVGAVPELAVEASLALDHEQISDYFNAGVLLINVKKWRADRLLEKLLDYAHANSEKITYGDQDILNGYLRGTHFKLDVKWNVTYKLVHYESFYKFLFKIDDVKSRINHPSIIHYLANTKPWSIFTKHLQKDRYFYYLDKIGYKYKVNPERQVFASKNVVLFGASLMGENLKKYLEGFELAVDYFCDNDPKKWDTTFSSIKVISPEKLKDLDNVAIIISSMYSEEISSQLISIGFVENKDYFLPQMLDFITWK